MGAGWGMCMDLLGTREDHRALCDSDRVRGQWGDSQKFFLYIGWLVWLHLSLASAHEVTA